MSDHIQIGDITPRDIITVTEVTRDGPWHFLFPIFADTDLEVYYDGVLKTLTTHYTVTGAGSSSGGAVTPVSAHRPEANTVITMVRRLDIKRTTDFQNSGEFRAKVINDELDFQTAALQQVQDDQSRSVRLQRSDAGVTMELPLKAERSSKVLGFDADGNLTVSTESMTDIEGSAGYAAAAAVSATDAGSSATSAATSATNAATSETNALSSESAAAASQASAATSASNANTSETNASTSATNAATSETNAAASASSASTDATDAGTSATNAGVSETNAAASEVSASVSEINAASSAVAAQTAANEADAASQGGHLLLLKQGF